MTKQTFTFKDFQKMFPDDDTCLSFVWREWYSDVMVCPSCDRETKFYRITTKKVYGCNFCGHQVSPTAGTIFHKSPTPLTTWFYVIYLMSQSLNGVSAKQVERESGVTYKCAWRMCTLVRKMLDEGRNPLTNEVEMDESYFGGEEKNKHADKRKTGTQGRSTKTKKAVFGMVERGGTNLTVNVVNNVKSETLMPIVKENVDKNAMIYTDQFNAYNPLGKMGYLHGVVPHNQGIFVLGRAHTNTIEGFWSLAKNGIRGTFHAVSDGYLQNYLNEYAFKYNHRKDTKPMFLALLSQVMASGKAA